MVLAAYSAGPIAAQSIARIYVEPFGNKQDQLRQETIRLLKVRKDIQVASSADNADKVLTGTDRTYIKDDAGFSAVDVELRTKAVCRSGYAALPARISEKAQQMIDVHWHRSSLARTVEQGAFQEQA